MIPHPKRWNRYDWAWIALLVGFVAIEVPALRNARHGDTLSEATRWFFGVGEEQRTHTRFLQTVGIAATAWLVLHIWGRRRIVV